MDSGARFYAKNGVSAMADSGPGQFRCYALVENGRIVKGCVHLCTGGGGFFCDYFHDGLAQSVLDGGILRLPLCMRTFSKPYTKPEGDEK